MTVTMYVKVFANVGNFFVASDHLLFNVTETGVLPSTFKGVRPGRGAPSFYIMFIAVVYYVYPFFNERIVN